MRDNREVVVKFLFKLNEVTDVIDSLVEAAAKFGSDCLKVDFFICDRSEDDEQLGRSLWRIGFIHGDFWDEMLLPFLSDDVPVDPSRLADCEQELAGDVLDIRPTGFERLRN